MPERSVPLGQRVIRVNRRYGASRASPGPIFPLYCYSLSIPMALVLWPLHDLPPRLSHRLPLRHPDTAINAASLAGGLLHAGRLPLA